MPIFEAGVAGRTAGSRAKPPSTKAYLHLARWHNDLKLTKPLPTEVTFFHERPYRVINCDQFADRPLRPSPRPASTCFATHGLGNLDQISDSTDILS